MKINHSFKKILVGNLLNIPSTISLLKIKYENLHVDLKRFRTNRLYEKN